MPKNIEVPQISKELIDYLDAMFPDKCAELKDTERDIFYKSGQRSVVSHLVDKFKIQQE